MSALAATLEQAAGFGGGEEGVTRFAWSKELFEVYDWLGEQLRELGLDVEIDAAGNLLASWDIGSGKAVLVGSHLDTVPHGGRYDGTLGVLAGLHAIRLLREWGVEPRRPVWLASFMDEEGARFGTALFGSRAFAGEDMGELADRRDAAGISLREAMTAAGFDFDRLPQARRIGEIGAYLELHIEQGPVLEQEGIELGIVTGIVGVRGFRARFLGEANHAGTTPMRMRRDALAAAARVILALREAALERGDITTNVGIISVEPAGFNVVPGVAEFTIDTRSATQDGFASLEPLVRETLERVASEEGLGLEVQEIFRLDPLSLDETLVATFARAAELEGVECLRLPSGAGHDAMVVGRHVPAGMLFAPSRRGISHSPEEYTAPEQCELASRVLARALQLLVTEA